MSSWNTTNLKSVLNTTNIVNNIDKLFDGYDKGLNVYNKVKAIADEKVNLLTDAVNEIEDFKNQLLASGFSFIQLEPDTPPSAKEGSWVDRLANSSNAPVIDSGMYSTGVCFMVVGANPTEMEEKILALKSLFK